MSRIDQGPERKVLSLGQAIEKRRALAMQGKTFVLTNGCFDLLHRGHVAYLDASAKLGDVLFVAINSDISVKQLKGQGRPINHEFDRAFLIAALECVDAAFVFDGPRLAAEIRELRPDVYTKAGDYTIEQLEASERSALQEVGAEIRFMPFERGYSTTSILSRI